MILPGGLEGAEFEDGINEEMERFNKNGSNILVFEWISVKLIHFAPGFQTILTFSFSFSFSFSFFLGRAVQLVGSQIPDQGLNPGPWQ